jgi:hypothetical protein
VTGPYSGDRPAGELPPPARIPSSFTRPRLAPGDEVVLAGPNVPYRVIGLETSGARASLSLETTDGRDWSEGRVDEPVTYTLRRYDEEARRAYVAEPLVETLAAARVGIEHVEHHGRPLRFAGSRFVGDTIEHRFACTDPNCPVVLRWSVTS